MAVADDTLRGEGSAPPAWLDALRRYIGFVAVANLLWELDRACERNGALT